MFIYNLLNLLLNIYNILYIYIYLSLSLKAGRGKRAVLEETCYSLPELSQHKSR